MINNERTERAYCPLLYVEEDQKEDFQEKIARLMADIEAFNFNNLAYDQGSQILPGCVYESMPAR